MQIAGLQNRIIRDAVSRSSTLQRGQVWCRNCGATKRVEAAKCLATGWPKCCGETMTLDEPTTT